MICFNNSLGATSYFENAPIGFSTLQELRYENNKKQSYDLVDCLSDIHRCAACDILSLYIFPSGKNGVYQKIR
jgi:hypothetical protein